MIKIARNGEEIAEAANYEAICDMVASGSVGLRDLYWEPGMDDWEEVQTIPSINRHSPAAPPIPVQQRQAVVPNAPPMHSQMPVTTSIATSTACKRGVLVGLAFLFGWFGIHNFYINRALVGVLQLLLTVVFCWTIIVPIAIWFWAVIESLVISADGNGNVIL